MLLKGFPNAKVNFEIVWVDMLPLDGQETAHKASSRLIGEDARVQQFFDPGHRAGEALAKRLGWDSPAWDIYLFFPPGSEWRDGPPEPASYAHQLPAHQDGSFRTGQDLEAFLHGEMARLLGEAPGTTRDGKAVHGSTNGGGPSSQKNRAHVAPSR